LEPDYFRKTNTRQELHVEYFFHGRLELQQGNDLAGQPIGRSKVRTSVDKPFPAARTTSSLLAW
jgi:hypothetical protein